MIEKIKFRKIEKQLLKELMSPAYKVSDKLESETALMKKFNASKVTIRTALQRLEKDGIILCEHGKRRVLLRKPADPSKIRSGMSFGIFIRNDFLTSMDDILGVSRGIANGLRQWNADLTILPISGTVSELEFVKRVVGRNMIDGLFITCMDEGPAIIDYMKSINFPCVSFDRMETTSQYDSKVPHVGLKEIEPFNSFCSKFRKLYVTGSPGTALDRTNQLLSNSHSKTTVKVKMDSAEKELSALIEALKEDELVIIASLELLSNFDLICRRFPERDLSNNVLVFKHCPQDLADYKGRYLEFNRPIESLGEEAAKLMREVILHQNAEEDLYNSDSINLEAVIKPI